MEFLLREIIGGLEAFMDKKSSKNSLVRRDWIKRNVNNFIAKIVVCEAWSRYKYRSD